MTRTASTDAQRRPAVTRAITTLFTLSTILFVLLGAVIVLVQLLEVVIGAGQAALSTAETLGPWAFGLSTVSGLLAFALTYTKTQAGEDEH